MVDRSWQPTTTNTPRASLHRRYARGHDAFNNGKGERVRIAANAVNNKRGSKKLTKIYILEYGTGKMAHKGDASTRSDRMITATAEDACTRQVITGRWSLAERHYCHNYMVYKSKYKTYEALIVNCRKRTGTARDKRVFSTITDRQTRMTDPRNSFCSQTFFLSQSKVVHKASTTPHQFTPHRWIKKRVSFGLCVSSV